MANLNPPAGDPPTVPPAGDPPVVPPALSLAELQTQLAEKDRLLKAANHESADRRKKLDLLEAAEEERKKAAMSETERLTTEAKEAQAKVEQAQAEAKTATERANERLMRAAVLEAATKAGFNDPNDAWLYVDRAKITAGDDDTFKGVVEAVAAVASQKKYLVTAAPRANGTPRSGGKPPAPENKNGGNTPRKALRL
jgi:chromosome segregation ATPase